MKSFGNIETCAGGRSPVEAWQRAAQLGLLYLVTEHELQDLRQALARGGLPADLESKLARLAGKGLIHRSVERNCRLFVALLLAANEGFFGEAGRLERERLLRVLAYVRKEDDAIPDYRPDGFVDDQQEVRRASTELGGLLHTFKTWRLRHQVPRLWLQPGDG